MNYFLTAKRKAFLSTINYAEGSPYYNEGFNYVLFNNNGPHPGDSICAGGYCSSAYGAYQFLLSTWQNAIEALNIPDDMSGKNQDQAAMYLIDSRGALQDVDDENFDAAFDKLSYEWASIPPSRYGQPVKEKNELIEFYYERKKIEQQKIIIPVLLLIIAITIYYLNK